MNEKHQGMKTYIFVCLIAMGFGFVVFSFGFMCGSDNNTATTESFLLNADKVTVTLDLSYAEDQALQPAAGYELKAFYYDLNMNTLGEDVLYVGVNESFEAIIAKIPSGEYNLKLIVLNKSLNLLYESDIVWVTITEPTTLEFLMELRNQETE